MCDAHPESAEAGAAKLGGQKPTPMSDRWVDEISLDHWTSDVVVPAPLHHIVFLLPLSMWYPAQR